ncbi:hypothetical protein M9435_003481 [Picochlorum sp. BPE23]|nr:hypothetical protein M9435_003481 [Picochlorum sp. BPE23]
MNAQQGDDDDGVVDQQQKLSSPMPFSEFLEKMKDPKAADLVRMIKNFIRDFERAKKSDQGSDVAQDGVKVQEFIRYMEGVFYKHPVWKDCSTEEVSEHAVEGLEKYIMSKIWTKTFGVSIEDKDKDERYQRLCDALGFVDLSTLMKGGDDGEADVGVLVGDYLVRATDHMLKMDRYKAPRDKLLCLVNVKTLIEEGILYAHSQGHDSLGGADAFFPMLLFVVIQAKPPSLASNIEYIRRFRGNRLSGQFDFLLSNLESVAMYLDTVAWQDLNISEDEFLARLAKAGIPEAEMQLQNQEAKFATGDYDTQTKVPDALIDVGQDIPVPNEGPGRIVVPHNMISEDILSPVNEKSPYLHRTDDAMGTSDQKKVKREEFNSIKALIEEGTPLVLHEESEGRLHQKYPWIYANAEDLRVGEVTQLLSDYRDLVLKHEALRLALEDQLPIRADSCVGAPNNTNMEDTDTNKQSVSGAAGSLMQKLSLYGAWRRGNTEASSVEESSQQSTLLHSLFGRSQRDSDAAGASDDGPQQETVHTSIDNQQQQQHDNENPKQPESLI